MGKIKNCLVCGNAFESKYGSEICSDRCRKLRTQEQNNKSNYRRRKGLSNSSEILICFLCGSEFKGLNRRYCPSCSGTARMISQRKINKEWYEQKKLLKGENSNEKT